MKEPVFSKEYYDCLKEELEQGIYQTHDRLNSKLKISEKIFTEVMISFKTDIVNRIKINNELEK